MLLLIGINNLEVFWIDEEKQRDLEESYAVHAALGWSLIIINIDSKQFGFMPERGTIDALFVIQRIQEKYRNKKKKL